METLKKQGRKWFLTINNPLEKGYTHEVIAESLSEFSSLIYYCMSDEVATTETHHTHLYFVSKVPIRFSTIKKKFPEAHIERAYGKSQENRNYVFKEGKWKESEKNTTNLIDTHVEWGEMPIERQGARNDLLEMFELIQEGKSNYDILEENPNLISQIDRMDRVRLTVQEERYKDVFRQLEVTYIFGETGKGKTRHVMEKYGYENVYRVTNYKHHPFDTYRTQDVICYEEFQGQLPITDMLVYLDGYPTKLPCRYSDRVACYTKVYLLSNADLFSLYRNEQISNPDTWRAFLRRINNVHVYKGDTVEEYTLEDYEKRFVKQD